MQKFVAGSGLADAEFYDEMPSEACENDASVGVDDTFVLQPEFLRIATGDESVQMFSSGRKQLIKLPVRYLRKRDYLEVF